MAYNATSNEVRRVGEWHSTSSTSGEWFFSQGQPSQLIKGKTIHFPDALHALLIHGIVINFKDTLPWKTPCCWKISNGALQSFEIKRWFFWFRFKWSWAWRWWGHYRWHFRVWQPIQSDFGSGDQSWATLRHARRVQERQRKILRVCHWPTKGNKSFSQIQILQD